jgi:hypothetical protein
MGSRAESVLRLSFLAFRASRRRSASVNRSRLLPSLLRGIRFSSWRYSITSTWCRLAQPDTTRIKKWSGDATMSGEERRQRGGNARRIARYRIVSNFGTARRQVNGRYTMTEESDLSFALAYLLCARDAASEDERVRFARSALTRASRWPRSWVSKAIQSSAHSYFFFDFSAALEVLGGIDELKELDRSGGLPTFTIKGLGSLCGRRHNEAKANLGAATNLQPGEPFIDIPLALTLLETGYADNDPEITRVIAAYAEHPLLELLLLRSPENAIMAEATHSIVVPAGITVTLDNGLQRFTLDPGKQMQISRASRAHYRPPTSDVFYINGIQARPKPKSLEQLRSHYGELGSVREFVETHPGDPVSVWNAAARQWLVEIQDLTEEVRNRYKQLTATRGAEQARSIVSEELMGNELVASVKIMQNELFGDDPVLSVSFLDTPMGKIMTLVMPEGAPLASSQALRAMDVRWMMGVLQLAEEMGDIDQVTITPQVIDLGATRTP